MSKGNPEIRFRIDQETENKVVETQTIIQSAEKSAGAKLLINLGYQRIKDAVEYVDSVSAPLNNTQFEQYMLSLKIHVLQLRKARKDQKNKV